MRLQFRLLDQVAISCCSKCRIRCCAVIQFVSLILGTLEVDSVGLAMARETTVVACSFIVPGGVWISVVHVIASGFSPSA
jgi:hypothetical protein